MSQNHLNVRELFSQQSTRKLNFPIDQTKSNKSPLAVGNFLQYAKRKNSDDRKTRNLTPVIISKQKGNSDQIKQQNYNEYLLSYRAPQYSFISKDSNRSRSKSPIQISFCKSPKQLPVDIKKKVNQNNEEQIKISNLQDIVKKNYKKFVPTNIKIPVNENPLFKIPKACSSTKIKPEIQNFEGMYNSLVQKYEQQQQHQKFLSQQQEEGQEDEKLKLDPQICVSKHSFIFYFVIGKGGFGKVWKVDLKKNRVSYAMKEMSKAKIITKRSVNSVMNERNLLASIGHPFIINMNYSFQDRDNLYLVMDLLTGGDLRYHIGRMRRFKEVQAKFFIACVILALEYLHYQNIIHRDVKPENVVLDENGYARLTDLGIARIWKPENSQDTSGTPGYMAPEVMCRQNHTIAVDYFALGVMTYEFMLGRRPYNGRSRQEIRDQVITRQILVKKNEIPKDWSLESADFINKLIQRKPCQRLGNNGPQEVKEHSWFQDFPWQKLINKEIESPFIPPPIQDNLEYLSNISEDNDTQNEAIVENRLLLRKNSIQNLFSGYSYDQSSCQIGKNTKSTNLSVFEQ